MDVRDSITGVALADEPPLLAARCNTRLGREGCRGICGGRRLRHQRGGARASRGRNSDAVPRIGADVLASKAHAGVPGDEESF